MKFDLINLCEFVVRTVILLLGAVCLVDSIEKKEKKKR